VTNATLRRIFTTQSDDYLSMITSKGIAAAIVGLASLSLVGVALANEAEGPDLADQVEVAAASCDTTTTTVDTTVDESTVDESTVDESDCDEADAVEEADDEAVEVEVEDEDETDETAVAEAEADAVEGDHPLNHGFYVSEATKTCPESGRERGQCISAVAKSDLGKPGADATTVTDGDATPEATVEEAPAPSSKPTATGKGQTKAKGKGKGKP
jgi:hypothetical protein